MGKIKSKLIKKSGKNFMKRDISFNENFENNKKILGNNTMPGKKIRNKMAGHMVRLKKQERIKQLEFANILGKN